MCALLLFRGTIIPLGTRETKKIILESVLNHNVYCIVYLIHALASVIFDFRRFPMIIP